MHLAIACGGTGGHFYPALAIAREHRRLGGLVTFLVAGHHAEEHLQMAAAEDFPAVKMEACRLPGDFSRLCKFPVQFFRANILARKTLRMLRPHVVLGMGSFAAAPACFAAVLTKTPLVLHEGNSLPGRANRLMSRFAEFMACSLPITETAGIHCKTIETGLPLRQSLLDAAESPDSSKKTGCFDALEADKTTVLVFGGSQGAEFLNHQVQETLSYLMKCNDDLQFIHLTGQANNDELVEAYKRAGIRAVVQTSEKQMEICYQKSDLVICRAGAATISELALFKKPAILIPLPSAAENHQSINAQMVHKRSAACFLPQHEAAPQILSSLIQDRIEHPEIWNGYAENIGKLARPAAAVEIVNLIQQIPMAVKLAK